MQQKGSFDYTFDIVISGGGTAGCVVAARLAESNKASLSILLIEGGQNNYEKENIIHPAFFHEHLSPQNTTARFNISNSSEALNGRSAVVPSGGILGGGSSINFCLYSRPLLRDFDAWGISEWNGENMKPFLNKLETYHGSGMKQDHGHQGPIHISNGTYQNSKVQRELLRSAKNLGFPYVEDLQDLKTFNGCSESLSYISPNGFRQDTAHRYLHPILRESQTSHPKLKIMLETCVVKVLFDERKRAVGVECCQNPTFFKEGTSLSPFRIRAKRMVILSCGACGTPPVLERSGLGDSKILSSASVETLVHLPGIGSNYQDHQGCIIPYRTKLKESETQDDFRSGRANKSKMMEEKSCKLGWNSIDVSIKANPTTEEISEMGQDFKEAWKKDFEREEKPLMLIAMASCFPGDHSQLPTGQYVSVCQHTAYPYSRGSLHITGPTIKDKINFETGFLTDAKTLDLKAQVWAYKKTRELMRRTEFYDGEVETFHPKFPLGSSASCFHGSSSSSASSLSAKSNLQDLIYSQEDDEAIEKFIRDSIGTTFHSLGTTKMAPLESNGVVDQNLNVYGVSNLKVIDLGIIPQNMACNTNCAAIAVGEKGADIILKELSSDTPSIKKSSVYIAPSIQSEGSKFETLNSLTKSVEQVTLLATAPN